MSGTKQDSFQHHCFDTEGSGIFQTPGVFIDSHGRFRACSCSHSASFSSNYEKSKFELISFNLCFVRKEVRTESDHVRKTQKSLSTWNEVLRCCCCEEIQPTDIQHLEGKIEMHSFFSKKPLTRNGSSFFQKVEEVFRSDHKSIKS